MSDILKEAFCIDKDNSFNREDALKVSEMGYRSAHFVCDLGDPRGKLPEFRNVRGMKFEIQVRTVLQHAWAELAHDRNYKFSGKLPKNLERELFLLAGLLETADKGVDELSQKIDSYMINIYDASKRDDLDVEINSLGLEQFVKQWADESNIDVHEIRKKPKKTDLVRELKNFGVRSLSDLREIIPEEYEEEKDNSTIYSIVRNWMIIKDIRKLVREVNPDWVLLARDLPYFQRNMSKSDYQYMVENIEIIDPIEFDED